MTTSIVQLCRLGDILSILPVAKWKADQGHKVLWVAHPQFGELLQGLSYLTYVPFECELWEVREATEFAKTLGADEILVTQVDGNPDPLEAGGRNFIVEQWTRAGCLDQFDRLPLVLDNRDAAAEAELASTIPTDKPWLLLNLKGQSSPYDDDGQLQQWIGNDFPQYRVVDLGQMKAKRFVDLLGLYDRAAAIATVDTATLHLGYATGIPTIALLNDDPWKASEPRQHWKLWMTYDQSRTPQGHERIREALQEIRPCTTNFSLRLPPVNCTTG